MKADHNPYDKTLTPLLHKYRQLDIDDWIDQRNQIVIEAKEKQERYEINRFIYRQDHETLSNQTMGRGGKHRAGKK